MSTRSAERNAERATDAAVAAGDDRNSVIQTKHGVLFPSTSAWLSSPANHGAAPCEPGAERAAEHRLAIPHLPHTHSLVERDRNRSARRVRRALDVDEAALLGNARPLNHTVDDAEVGLVRDQPVDV